MKLFSRTYGIIRAGATRTTWALLIFAMGVLPADAQDKVDPDAPLPSQKARLEVVSDPPGLVIRLNDRRLDAATPVVLDMNPGQYSMTLNAEGFQPLSHDFALASGERVALEFLLLSTPPEPPTQEELRALSPPFWESGPNADFWADAKPRHLANDACKDCHDPILKLHAQGDHRNLACEDCHGSPSDHVKDDVVVGKALVLTGEAIQPLCMLCHDPNNRSRKREPARTVEIRRHQQKLRVTAGTVCEDCHHVHDPMMWVHQAREMVGVPEKMSTIPLLNSRKSAYAKREGYNTTSEIFLVFPTAPGILGLALGGTEGRFPSIEFVSAGLVLAGTSYLMGKWAQGREYDRVEALNDERRAVNAQVKEHNRRVAEAMEAFSAELTAWAEEVVDRGVVNVTR